jgi:dTDP-4-dehydrorhamnose reductase
LKILLLGGSGQVGWELQRSLASLGDLITPGRTSGSAVVADLSHPDELAATVRATGPDLIVNSAAYTAVDRAESEPDLARTVNATAPGILARECGTLGALLVHFSTDYVFDGRGRSPWREDDPKGPLNVYGRTKLDGETLIRDSGCRHLIFRTSWVYAARGQNFLRTMLRLAAEREALTVVDDQFGAPTGAELLADVAAHALRRAIDDATLCGTYHLAASGETSWHRYAVHAIEYARTAGVQIRVAPNAIRAVPSSEFATPALRPANSRLATERLREAFDVALPDWRCGVERAVSEILAR